MELIHTRIRHDWTLEEVEAMFAMPFMDLLHKAQCIHRENFDPNEVQVSTLLSIKTGSCPEDCAYCPQSAHHNAELDKEKLMEVEKVLTQARAAKDKGATRFCMGAAWKNPNGRDFPYVLKMIEGVRDLGMESCMTLGMLSPEQTIALKEAGLDYYNHNLDTSREYYEKIISTRTYDDRLNTLENVRNAGINVCSGGIMGMGETETDRANLFRELANLPEHPQSVPVNLLIKVKGTPLENVEDLDPFDFVRAVAVARIMMPKSHVRLSAGREIMDDATQALCFHAGANSIFYGDKLLTTANPAADKDRELFERLGLRPEGAKCNGRHQSVQEDAAAAQHA
ncbi:biotin synthase BioB [Aestuariispira insulae]|uniref:Biotin synthase n=1 Tax=Aestuariispira insulae TaxID=1461337 RepID=A0A3D9HVW8_9PROT|nr:biotin synthase BioB [Aestuariispira insulae]RED53555.1 biotin synthase [Aestuariispira insulae]